MDRIAFLSADNLEGYVVDDDLSHEPLRQLGWKVETISWRKTDLDWSEFAGAIIRSTWDYQRDLPAFLAALERIAASTRIANSLGTVRWNADKIYLRELQARGARIPLTIWRPAGFDETDSAGWFEELQSDELVIKPTISANAENTVRLRKGEPHFELVSIFAARSYMVQPFMDAIVEEGEFSLFYFSGTYSHAILKKPKPRDFRVQEEHGGLIEAVHPSADLLRAGEAILQLLSEPMLYARVDFVREDNEFALMELELIEPSLYLRTDENAPLSFASAIDRWLS